MLQVKFPYFLSKTAQSGFEKHPRVSGCIFVDMGRLLVQYLAMIKINIAEARANFSRYIESVERGETITVCCRDPRNDVYLSALSGWEIAIKYRLGRLQLPERPDRYVASRRKWLQLESLPFDENSAAYDALLPVHHSDPFDRDLVSQAILNGLTIVTPDAQIARYPAPVMW